MSPVICYSTQPEIKPLLSTLKPIFVDAALSLENVNLAENCDTVCAFVTDDLSKPVLTKLAQYGVKHIALRSSGYDHVDLDTTEALGITVSHVPAYSPEAIAEHAIALTLMLSHKLKQALVKQQHDDFDLNGLLGFNIHGKTVGVVGTGSIGCVYAQMMQGLGAKVIAYDPTPKQNLNIDYVDLGELFERSDIISLHCPLNLQNRYLINPHALQKMKNTAILINTARGGLVDTKALLYALDHGIIAGAGLDVYEFEKGVFFRKLEHLNDPLLQRLLKKDNVIVTPHQAFFTEEALSNIAEIVIKNIQSFNTESSKHTALSGANIV